MGTSLLNLLLQAITLGSHGEEMAPIASLARIKGRSLDVFLDEDAIATCVTDAVTGGGQVVALKKSGFIRTKNLQVDERLQILLLQN